MYNKAQDILSHTKKNNSRICDVVLQNECKHAECSTEEVRGRVREILKVMQEAAQSGIDKETMSISGLIGGNAVKVDQYRKTNKRLRNKIRN